MTFYLKYRPQKIDELDIEAVRETLGKVVASGSIPHAFLFSGPKGTGKTSAARILAKIVNCEHKQGSEPCNKCEQCLSITKGNNIDVIEIDAASHRGIDDIRALRDAVKLSAARASKKVYIIDEAHMLTPEASNALLKTLEEPPGHVIFILATTNPEKLIDTVKSRTVNVPFKKATTDEIARSLKRVVAGEKIKIKDEALGTIAEVSDGSFRDAVKILEQMVLEKRSLTRQEVEEYLLQRKNLDIKKFVDLLAKKDTKSLLVQVEKVVKAGVSIENLIENILTRLRSALLSKVGVGGEDLPSFDQKELVYLIELFSRAGRVGADSPIEQLPFEIAVIEWCERIGDLTQPARLDSNSASETGLTSSRSRVAAAPTLDSTSQALPQTKESFTRGQAQVPIRGKVKEINDEIWRKILTTVRPINTSIEALLRAAKPIGFDGKSLTLGVFYRFHKERLEEIINRRVLEEAVEEVLGLPVKVVCTLTEPPKKQAPPAPVLTEGEDTDIIKIAEEIFGN